jgi:hypothetical protein
MSKSSQQIIVGKIHRKSESQPSGDTVCTSVAIATSASGASVIHGSSAKMCTSRAGGAKVIIDSEPTEPLDDEECDSADRTKSRVTQ